MKRKESKAENQNCTCPNPSCGKIFTNPVRVENLCSRSAKVYEACPFCLTEITLDDTSVAMEEKKDSKIEESEGEEEKRPRAKMQDESLSKVHGCSHHLGYLSKRSSKESIPEECMICEKIVQCMLKNVTS